MCTLRAISLRGPLGNVVNAAAARMVAACSQRCCAVGDMMMYTHTQKQDVETDCMVLRRFLTLVSTHLADAVHSAWNGGTEKSWIVPPRGVSGWGTHRFYAEKL